MSIHNVTNAVAVMLGASIGAAVLKAFGESHNGYMILFTVSILSRMVTAFALERIVLKVGAKHLAPSHMLKSSLSLIRRDQRSPSERSAS